MPYPTVLMLFQIFIICYLMHFWIVESELHDPKYTTNTHKAWKHWIIFEVAMTLASIFNTMLYLTLKSFCKMDPATFTSRKNLYEKDILMRDQDSIDMQGCFIVPGLTGFVITHWMDDKEDNSLRKWTIIQSCIFTLAGILWAVAMIKWNNF